MLRKDFTVDPYQIYEARLMGADCVLLICALLETQTLKEYLKLCEALGLAALVETHDETEVRSALAKCGLTTKHIESMVKVLSGGEQAKVRLCKLINNETNVLLLDEPTNHLDVDAKEELKRALQAYKGSILLICHELNFIRML